MSSPVPLLDETRLRALVFFVHSLSRDRAHELLSVLGESARSRAEGVLARLQSWTSVDRQATATVLFGLQPNAASLWKETVAQVPTVLQVEMFRMLPPAQRCLFPPIDTALSPGEPAPIVRVLAARLLRQALR